MVKSGMRGIWGDQFRPATFCFSGFPLSRGMRGVCGPPRKLMPLRLRPAAFERKADARETETADPVDESSERVSLFVHADPVRIGECRLGDPEQIQDRDNQDQRRVL